MTIELRKSVTEEDGQRRGFLWTNETDPTWMRFHLDTETGAMRGMHVSRTGGKIPKVTPFIYQFATPSQGQVHMSEVIVGIFADVSKERVLREGDLAEKSVSMSDKLDAWNSFLGNQKTVQSDQAEREISVPKDLLGRGLSLIKRKKDGALAMPRLPNFNIGKPMSGFDSLTVAKSRGLPKGLQVGPIGDPDVEKAKKALASVSRPSSLAVSWYGTRDPEKAKLRGQAAQAFPVLAGMIAESPSLRSAVDEMCGIHAIISDRIGLAKAGLKRVGKLRAAVEAAPIFENGERAEGEDALGVNRARMTRITGAVPIDMSLRYLKDLPADRVPSDDESWKKYHDILTAVAIPLHNALGVKIEDVLSQSKGNWVGYHASLAKAADFEPENFGRRSMALTTIDAIEAIHHFERSAVMPQILADIAHRDQPAPELAAEFLNDGFDVARDIVVGKTKNVAVAMMEMARRYASRIPALYRIEGGTQAAFLKTMEGRFAAYGNSSWPKMAEAFTASNGLVLRPLTSEQLLSQESDRLGHCVRGYGSRSKSMNCHIFSIQPADGSASLSTIEFHGLRGDDPIAAGAGLKRVQHRALRNRAPSEEAKQAEKEFTHAVKTGAHPVNLEEINAWQDYLETLIEADNKKNNRGISASWHSVLEFDYQDEEARMGIWEEWGQVLGGAVAKANNPGAIYMARSAQDLVGAMSPRTASLMIEEQRQAREEREAAKKAAKEVEAAEEPMGP